VFEFGILLPAVLNGLTTGAVYALVALGASGATAMRATFALLVALQAASYVLLLRMPPPAPRA
jgi:branched-subunit amino acid ABC-type transport system permease component